MLSLVDISPDIIYPTRDWRRAALCREMGVEMVPGGDGSYVSEGDEILAAKKVCRDCPVKQQCRTAAGISAGVWAGLTQDERERLRDSQRRTGIPRRTVPCAQCGLDCVPAIKAVWKCDTCLTPDERPKSVEQFKESILEMVRQGHTYAAIAERFGLRKSTVGKACRRWDEAISKPGRRSVEGTNDAADLAPCGTPAGRRRHERRGETELTCACGRPGHAVVTKVKRNNYLAA